MNSIANIDDQSASLPGRTVARPTSIWGILLREAGIWLPIALLSIIAASVLMSGWPQGLKPNIEYPFAYIGDALSHGDLIKRELEQPWYYENDRIGYPFGSNVLDYPDSDSGSFVIFKVLGWVFGTYFAVYNVYFLLGFAVAAPFTYAVLRKFALSWPFAAAATVAFLFLPFHFERIYHLFYTWYFMVPLYFYFGHRLASEADLFDTPATPRKLAGYAAAFLLLACFGVYYTVFGVIVVFIGGVAGAIQHRSWRPIAIAVACCGLLLFGILLNGLPHLAYEASNGDNAAALERPPGQTEIYGLKLAHLLLPRADHRLEFMQDSIRTYNKKFPLINENATSTLGLVGATGFLLLLCFVFAKLSGREPPGINGYLALTVLAFALLALVGGFASLFALFVSPLIRAWNRVSVFIAFASIATAFLYVQFLCERIGPATGLRRVGAIIAPCLGLLAFLDQTVPACQKCNAELSEKFTNDREFVSRIESTLPKGAAIFQMPFMGFPEMPPILNIGHYEPSIGFLHSVNLKWSYGVIKGRIGDVFYKALAQQNVARQVDVIRKLGFAGIWVDRRGYQDGGKAVESDLQNVLGAAPQFMSVDKKIAFYNLGSAAPLIAPDTDPREIMQRSGFSVDLPASQLGSR